jgi:SAM-dependent methyltransferase
VTYHARQALERVPVATIQELFPGKQLQPISIPGENVDRGPWNLHIHAEILIRLTVQALEARRIFEIGTFDGGTTRVLAETAGAGSEVFTLDLPEAEFNQTQQPPPGFSGAQIGKKFRGTAVETRIKQLFGNSLKFDFSAYERSIDLIFIDSGSNYPHALANSRTALRLVRPGGVIIWDMFCQDHPGLVHAVIEATAGLPLKRLGVYSPLAFLRKD